jgi:hypothetical protein
MQGALFALYVEDGVDEDEVLSQLAELHAIPGVRVVPFAPTDLNDAVSSQ